MRFLKYPDYHPMQWWKNLSIFKKLYGVVGVMALLIALELFTLRFSMHTLSAVRAFVGGEGNWSKAQKDAISDLQKYILTQNPRYYSNYLEHLRVPIGDHKARQALQSREPDLSKVYQGFIEGQIHPLDIPGVIELFQRFHDNSYLARAIGFWSQGDDLISELMSRGERIHSLYSLKKPTPQEIDKAISELEILNGRLTIVEDEFSSALGEGSRFLETTVLLALLLAVLTVETTGIFLTYSFSRNLSRGLNEINLGAKSLGSGHFEQRVAVRSNDELGQLAGSINQLARELEANIGRRHDAETASQWKSMFLANVSHEIRTPLGSIMGFTELLKDPGLLLEERDRYIGIIQRTSENLNNLINDILDLSKVEAGHLAIEEKMFATTGFFDDLFEVLNVKAQSKEVDLRLERIGRIPSSIRTDAERLRQILMNLIGNSIKFTPAGGSVRVIYQVRSEQLRVTIADTGPGIPREHQGRLFQPFSQASAEVGKSYGGTGLGLFLSRRLARALGGDVTLEMSSPGKGATFVATVKLAHIESQTQPSLNSMAREQVNSQDDASRRRQEDVPGAVVDDLRLAGRKILVVDDTQDNQLLIHRILSKRGAIVSFANNGKEAIEKALSEPFNLILMDIQMPIMNGDLAVRELRQRGYTQPIVAMTAQAMKEDRDKALSDGCDDYLAKPIPVHKLLQVVTKYSGVIAEKPLG